jgi:hypothetical protein
MMSRNPKKAQNLLKASEGATHASAVTAGVAESLSKGMLSQRQMKQLSEDLKAAARAMDIVNENAAIGAGEIGGTGAKYAHQRLKVYENNRMKDEMPVGADKATPMSELKHFVNTGEGTLLRRTKRKVLGNHSAKTPKKKPELVLPVPQNGCKYTRSEVGDILADAKHCRGGDAINEMRRLGYTDLALWPLSGVSALQRPLKAAQRLISVPV